MQRFAMVPAVLVVVVVTIATTTAASFKDAFAPSFSNPPRSRSLVQQHQVARGADTDDFASFAAALEADAEEQKQQQQTSVQSSSIHNSNNNRQATTKTTTKIKKKTWQADLERLMDPTTPSSQRQILLSDLVNANAEIRASVEAALRDRNVCNCNR